MTLVVSPRRLAGTVIDSAARPADAANEMILDDIFGDIFSDAERESRHRMFVGVSRSLTPRLVPGI